MGKSEIRAKEGRGILVERDGVKFTRKASADQRSPRVKAHQACVRVKAEGESAENRKDWQERFKQINKECKRELKL